MKILLFAYVLLALGCQHLKEGRVVDKEYTPAYSYWQSQPMMCGKTMIITGHMVYVHERFEVTIKGLYENDSICETHYIGETLYNSIKIGQQIKIQ